MISPEQLRRYPFFGGLTAEELASIAMIADEMSYADGTTIFRDGELATKLYVLTSGTVDLAYHIERPNGMETTYVGSIVAGEPFGISALVEPYRLTASGVTLMVLIQAIRHRWPWSARPMRAELPSGLHDHAPGCWRAIRTPGLCPRPVGGLHVGVMLSGHARAMARHLSGHCAFWRTSLACHAERVFGSRCVATSHW